MGNNINLIKDPYSITNLLPSILKAIKAAGKDINNLTLKDLAPVDAFHIRGIESTKEIAELIKIIPAYNILDIGCGLGGSARYLASNYGCHITGIDITEEYCKTATGLSKLLNLEDKTEFHHADAINLPFENEEFDIVWSEHVQMNVEKKQNYFREIYRVLKPKGKLVFYEVFKGIRNNIFYPVPWAENSSTNFLSEQNEIKSFLETLYFKIEYWEDKTDLSKNWFNTTVKKMKTRKPYPLGLHLVMGKNSDEKFLNMFRNLNEGNITVAQGVATKQQKN